MDVIASAAFGVDSQNFENINSAFAVNARPLQDNLSKFIMFKFMIMILLPSLAKKMKLALFNAEAMDFLESIVKESIRRRKENGEKRNNFLQLLLEAQDEISGELTQSRDSVSKRYVPALGRRLNLLGLLFDL